MVINANQTCDTFTIYINTESGHCTPETDTMLYVNFISKIFLKLYFTNE